MISKETLCLGIDPKIENFPPYLQEKDVFNAIHDFGEALLETGHSQGITKVKFQSAYFEVFGMEGYKALKYLIKKAKTLGFYIILDGKRGDIGTSAAAYAQAYLEPGKDFEVDALTMHAYHGFESLNTCFEIAKNYTKRIFVLVRTSNPGAENIQDHAAPFLLQKIEEFNSNHIQEDGFGPIGAVVGATQGGFAQLWRKVSQHTQWLCPGVGFQGADVKRLAHFSCFNGDVMFPVSRGISGTQDANKGIFSDKGYREAVADRMQSTFE